VEIARQQDSRRDECDGDHERQTVLDHAAPVVVVPAVALVFCEAQQEYDVRFVGRTARLNGFAGVGVSTSEANYDVVPIARLMRLRNQRWTSVLHHIWCGLPIALRSTI
jgi:hypothetical protein